MKLSIVLLAFIAVHVQAIVLTRGNIEPLSVEHVEYINQLNTTWKVSELLDLFLLKNLKIKIVQRLLKTLKALRLTNFVDFAVLY